MDLHGTMCESGAVMMRRGMVSRAGFWAASACVAVCALGCGARPTETATKSDGSPRTTLVEVARVEKRLVERSIDGYGTLRGWENVTIGAKGSGRVVKVRHDIGDRVAPGELLVELDSIDADLAVREAQRRLEAELTKLNLKELPTSKFDEMSVPSVVQAKVSLDRSKNNLARERSLIQRGAGTAQDFQNAENDVQAAEAVLENAVLNVRSIRASALTNQVLLDVMRAKRRDIEIRVPVPSAAPQGAASPPVYAVTRRSVSEGQMLKEGDPVFDLVIVNPLRLSTYVDEEHSAQVRVGQPVRIKVISFPGKPFEGVVTRINPSIGATSLQFQVETLVPNPDMNLRPGNYASARIVIDARAEATVVPIDALVRRAGVKKVFIVEGNQAREVPVELGEEWNDSIEVVGNVPANAQVITSGNVQLADGAPIAVKPPRAKSNTKTAPVAEVQAKASEVPAARRGDRRE